MKSRLLISAALLALVAASPALADRHDKDNPSNDNSPRPSREAPPPRERPAPVQNVAPGGGMGGGRHEQGGAAVAPTGGMGARTFHRTRTDTGATGPTMGGSRRDVAPNTMMRPSRRGTAIAPSGTMAPRGGAIGTGAHVHNHAFDSMRRAFSAPRRFRAGVYVRPSGWYYHRWTYGEFLPVFFFTRNYWILDWEDFDLDDPPPGTVWVRYGNDALLIDEYTGEVIEVVYGIFY